MNHQISNGFSALPLCSSYLGFKLLTSAIQSHNRRVSRLFPAVRLRTRCMNMNSGIPVLGIDKPDHSILCTSQYNANRARSLSCRIAIHFDFHSRTIYVRFRFLPLALQALFRPQKLLHAEPICSICLLLTKWDLLQGLTPSLMILSPSMLYKAMFPFKPFRTLDAVKAAQPRKVFGRFGVLVAREVRGGAEIGMDLVEPPV